MERPTNNFAIPTYRRTDGLSVAPATQPVPKPPKPIHQKLPRQALFAGIGLIIAGLGAGLVWWLWPVQVLPLPRQVTVAPYTLYSPVSLPAGYVIDEKKSGYASGVATVIARRTADTIIITQQAKPLGFSFAQISSQGLSNVKSFSTRQGAAISGKYPSGTAAMLATDSTLIVISSPTNLDVAVLEKVLRELRPIND